MARSSLSGLRVLVTRPSGQAGPWTEALLAAGADPILYPTIVVEPPPSWDPLDAAWRRIDDYHWLLFTSVNAARFALSRCPDATGLAQHRRPRVAAVGAETARFLRDVGIRVDLVPEDQRQEGLLAAWTELAPGTRILFPQADGGRDTLAAALQAQGVAVDTVVASVTRPATDMPALPAFDAALFASPSSLRALCDRHGIASLSGKMVVAIGPTTAEAASALALRPIVARAPDIDAVLAALLES